MGAETQRHVSGSHAGIDLGLPAERGSCGVATHMARLVRYPALPRPAARAPDHRRRAARWPVVEKHDRAAAGAGRDEAGHLVLAGHLDAAVREIGLQLA